ncbi:hypothetical protein [Candidatus Poriferisocius sp.]
MQHHERRCHRTALQYQYDDIRGIATRINDLEIVIPYMDEYGGLSL